MTQHLSTDLLNIAYHEVGPRTGPAVLLLHGWPNDATTWDGVMPQLAAAGYRVIAPWLRGFGTTTFLSEHTPRTGNSGIHALDVLSLMDALAIDTVSVVGHDWGSNIAEALAVGWPDRTRPHCAAVDATPPGWYAHPSFWARSAGMVPLVSGDQTWRSSCAGGPYRLFAIGFCLSYCFDTSSPPQG